MHIVNSQLRPKVSIITAVYNSKQYLSKTIESVINQSYPRSLIEFIVIDGGSTDGTLDVIESYRDKIDIIVSEKDEGIADAFNKGIRLSTGDYINFQGAGDVFCSNLVIEQMMEQVDAKRDKLLCGRIIRIDEHDETPLWVAPKIYNPIFDKRSLLFKMSLPHQALFTHKHFFEKYGLFDKNCRFAMDYEHLLRAYHQFPNVVLKDVLVSKWRAGGVGQNRIVEIFQEYSRIKKQHKVASDFVIDLISAFNHFKRIVKLLLNRV